MINDLVWRKVMRIALTYPGITIQSPIIKSYAKRFGLRFDDLEILAKEAEHDKTKYQNSICLKCNGQGKFRTCPQSLCGCEQSQIYETAGGRTWDTSLK